MRKLMTLLLCLTALMLDAQELDIPTSFSVQEQQLPLDGKQCNAFTVSIQGESKAVKKSFKTYMEDRYAIEVKGLGSSLKGEALNNSRISDKIFNLLFKVEEGNGTNSVALFINFSNGEYVNSQEYASEAGVFKNLLKDFAKSFYAQEVNERIAVKTEELEKLNKERKKDIDEQTSLAKDISKNEKKIAKYESKLAKAQEKIEKYQEKIKGEEKNIADGGQEVESLKAENTKVAAQKAEIETKLESNNKLITEKSNELKALQAKLAQLLSF